MKLLSKQDTIVCNNHRFSFDLTVMIDDEHNAARFNFRNFSPNSFLQLPSTGLNVFAGLDGDVRPIEVPTQDEFTEAFITCVREFIRNFDLKFWYR